MKTTKSDNSRNIHPIFKDVPYFLHGADYNPDQWLHMPEIIDQDFELMKEAHCNVMSINIFGWTAIEPEEGQMNWQWLDNIMDRLAANNMHAILATPSGARPAWMAAKYPEVLRVEANRVRNLYGNRHNHCFTSPIYRQKTSEINEKLANRYKNHKALLAWHISNEYSGECHCPLCQEAFRNFLKAKYNNDLALLNRQWWTSFWSHTYTSWEQIESPAPHGEGCIHGLELDWRRFVTAQTIDFYQNEVKPLKEITPDIPATANFMETFDSLDYDKFRKVVDIISWDSYPRWRGQESDIDVASYTAFNHDWFRAMIPGQPFMLMESTPSLVNWQPVSALKRPNQHLLSSMQAVAHGADTVQYFQWRKGLGGVEKFHGAVVDHSNTSNTRVFKDVAHVGASLEKLQQVIGTGTNAKVALVFDTENRWALKSCQALKNDYKDYLDVCLAHYRALWKQGINVDVISSEVALDGYEVVVAPMLYMVKPGVAEKIETFVEKGGQFITTYWSGIVNENDLCFMGGFPGPLRKVLGVWSEEIDTYEDGVTNSIAIESDLLTGTYESTLFSDLFHLEGAKALGTFEKDFFQGQPALSVNDFGKGKAFYIGFKGEERFLEDFYGAILERQGLQQKVVTLLPKGVSLATRNDGQVDYHFLMNFTDQPQLLFWHENLLITENFARNVLTGELLAKEPLRLEPFGIYVIESPVSE